MKPPIEKARRLLYILRHKFPRLSREEIFDAYQDAWEHYYRLSDQQRDKIINHAAWMTKVAIRCASMTYRRSCVREAITYDVVEESESDEFCNTHVYNSELYEQIIEAINKLPQNMCSILYQHYFAGYTYKEIALMNGKTEESIKKSAQRALIKLRIIWD